MKPLSYAEFMKKLVEKYGNVYSESGSTGLYCYARPNFDGIAECIGIYTNNTHYYIKEA